MEEMEAVHVREEVLRVQILKWAIFRIPRMICRCPKGLRIIGVSLDGDYCAKMRLRFVIWPSSGPIEFLRVAWPLFCAPLLLFVSLVTYLDLMCGHHLPAYYDYHFPRVRTDIVGI